MPKARATPGQRAEGIVAVAAWLGDTPDLGIDLVETHQVSRLPVRRHRSGPKSDHRDPARCRSEGEQAPRRRAGNGPERAERPDASDSAGDAVRALPGRNVADAGRAPPPVRSRPCPAA